MTSTIVFWLALTVLMTASQWVVYVLNRFAVVGPIRSLQTPSDDWPAVSEWAQRAKAAHSNAIENLVVFAPLAILVSLKEDAPELAATAAAVFFFARIVHFVTYTLSIPFVRTLGFVTGYGVVVYYALILLGWV